MKAHVCAAVVAFNNPNELDRLLLSLDTQDEALSGLIVIDNSDDQRAIDNEEIFSRHAPRYAFTRYRKIGCNIGSAGGFHSAMKTAHENDFDWVWLLDQDGVVSPGCLATLLRRSQEGAILCPNIVDIGQPSISAPKIYTNNILGGWYPALWCPSSCHIHTFGTHGALISKKALDMIGYYDDALFFVGWEDYDYGYRATGAGLVIAFVKEAMAMHPGSRSSAQSKTLRWTPTRLESIGALQDQKTPCEKTRALAPLSQAYLESRHLTWWQFGMALVYSSLLAFYHKVTRAKTLSLTATLRLFLKCLAYNVKKTWPHCSVQHLCREVFLECPPDIDGGSNNW